MKKTFLLALIICSLSASAQQVRLSHMWEIQHTKDFDTIPCVMIVTNDDTGISTTAGFSNPLAQAMNDNRIPFWIKGYRVNKFIYGGWVITDDYVPAHWEQYGYFDEKMQSLKFRVWMVQETSK